MIGYSLFMKRLIEMLVNKGLSNSSINCYIKQLERLNGDTVNNLKFLFDYDDIMSKLEKYGNATRKNYLAMINSILGLFNEPKYEKLKDKYYKLMMELDTQQREDSKSNEKSQTQKDNWLDWEDIEKVKKELENDVNTFKSKQTINEKQYDKILDLLLLSLYTDIPPRRNEYKDMIVVKKWKPTMPNDVNYYSQSDNTFIFNVYKTSKKYGQQILKLEDNNKLISIIKLYLKHHPLKNETNYDFLVSHKGTPFIINTITKRLNSIFGKKIGASMLRHIYLTHKYADDLEQMKLDSQMMAHSMNEQKEYIKK